MSRRDDDRFIDKLLEETYQESASREANNCAGHSFFRYSFEDNEQVNNFFEGQAVACHYIGSLGCYRLQWGGYTFDFPRTWSIFNYIGHGQQNIRLEILEKNHDSDMIFEVLSKIDPSLCKLLVSEVNGELTFVPISASNIAQWEEIEKNLKYEEQAIAA